VSSRPSAPDGPRATAPDGPRGTPPDALFEVEPGAHDALADLAATAGTRIEQELPPPRTPLRRWAAWLWLALAIVAGVTGTTALSRSAGFTRWQPLLLVAAAYLVCFIALTRALHTIPVGIAYAIWSGVGIALVSTIGWLVYGQSLDMGEAIGITLILVGTVVIQLFSRAAAR